MGTVTTIGVPFTDPLNKPLSTAGQFQSGCYRVFYLTGTLTLAPVYRDAACTYPFNQVTMNAFPTVRTIGVPAWADGAFPPIWLNPAIQYRCQLYSAAGALLEDCDPINIANTSIGFPSYAVKVTDTTRVLGFSATAPLAGPLTLNDPELSLYLPAAGTYRIEADLIFLASISNLNSINAAVAFGGSFQVGTTVGNILAVSGFMNNTAVPANELFTALVPFNGVAYQGGIVNTTLGQNCLHFCGTIVVTSAGTLRIQWAQNSVTPTAPLSLVAGSSLSAAPL